MTAWYEIANADEIASPTVLIYPQRVEENVRRMIAVAGDVSRLRPHVKTHKLPQIVAIKRSLGITKFKTSTIAETEMTASEGGEDVMLAYPLVGPNIRRLAQLIERYPQTRFTSLVDNVGTLETISRIGVQSGITFELFVDLNVGMNRTGISIGPAVEDLYARLCHLPGVKAAGLHAYDGHLHNPDHQSLTAACEQAFAPVWKLRTSLQAKNLAVPKVVAGGTPTSPLLVHGDDVEVGAGTTVLWDFGQTETTPDQDFLNAAVILGRVISKPLDNRLCLDVGHKAVASEMVPPRARWFGLEDAVPVIHSEEHLVLQTDRASQYAVGQVVYGIPRHVCPTIALHSEVQCVRDGRATESWPVVARARRLTV
jgi:D-serine deaminase-like pyridoxal phosphate-dependent protein